MLSSYSSCAVIVKRAPSDAVESVGAEESGPVSACWFVASSMTSFPSAASSVFIMMLSLLRLSVDESVFVFVFVFSALFTLLLELSTFTLTFTFVSPEEVFFSTRSSVSFTSS